MEKKRGLEKYLAQKTNELDYFALIYPKIWKIIRQVKQLKVLKWGVS